MSASARLDLTLPQVEKSTVARAAALLGTTVAGFVRSAAQDKARQVLAEQQQLTLSQRDFAGFMKALEAPFVPNPALSRALKAASKVERAPAGA